MTNFKYLPTDHDLEIIVDGVLSSSKHRKEGSSKMILIGLGLILIGATATYITIKYPFRKQPHQNNS